MLFPFSFTGPTLALTRKMSVFNSRNSAFGTACSVLGPRAAKCRLMLFMALLSLFYRPGSAATEKYEVKNVLILYSHERELSTYTELDHALRATLQSDFNHPVAFYTEYLDLFRFPEERRQRVLVDYLRIKYSNQKIDLVVLVSPLAFNFFNKYGQQLFHGIPAVFTSVGSQRLEGVRLEPNVTGVAVQRDLRDTMDFVLRLQPDTTSVVIPAGSSSIEKTWMEEALKSLSSYSGRLSITVLRDLMLKEMLARLSNLPPHTIILFASPYYQDASGNYFLPEDVLELISHSSNAPVYGLNEPYLGHGILGGDLYNMAEPGQAAGIIGARILAGEKISDIPVQTINPNHFMVDARQLRRWSIAESRLPSGTLIRFKQQSTWELYRWYFLGAVFLVMLQSLLIVTLVVQGRRLRHSEATLKDLSRHLINAQEDERRRIARELHDDFGQRLALLKIGLEMLSQEKGPVLRQSGREPLQNLLANVADLAEDIQDLSHRLHSSKLQYIGLKAALTDLGRQISKQHQISIELKASELTDPVPDETALCFYRVAQEALHNAAKHSGANQVVMAVSGKNATLKMRITDNGHGFDQAEASLGLGLASMRERLQMIGGNLKVISKPGAGTRLTAEAPLQESFKQAKVG